MALFVTLGQAIATLVALLSGSPGDRSVTDVAQKAAEKREKSVSNFF